MRGDPLGQQKQAECAKAPSIAYSLNPPPNGKCPLHGSACVHAQLIPWALLGLLAFQAYPHASPAGAPRFGCCIAGGDRCGAAAPVLACSSRWLRVQDGWGDGSGMHVVYEVGMWGSQEVVSP